MIIRYIGFTVAGLLFLLSFAFFAFGIYKGIKHSYESQSPVKPLKSSIKYQLWSALSFGMSFFVFLTTENGFAWETLGFSIFLIVLMVFLIGLDHFLRLKTTIHLYKEGVPFSSLFEREKKENEAKKGDLGKEKMK